ncbi:PRC-barrel domain-containing protein [Polymorphobacter sp.]|uniref:PRC-barrel domain-containing protein n=1 Tax=Polymorphobacter sp. TaxID=1909290 RepID=UPI003F72CAE6
MSAHNPLISSDRVEGTEVIDAEGNGLGSIHSLMINKHTGEVAYAVMSFGGFLGIGEKYHPLPWSLLDYEPEMGGYRVHIDRDTLERAPSYSPDEVEAFDTGMLDTHYQGAVRGRTLADDRGPRIEGNTMSSELPGTPARPGMSSPAAKSTASSIDEIATNTKPVL